MSIEKQKTKINKLVNKAKNSDEKKRAGFVRSLLKYLDNDSWKVREAAVEALGEIRDKSATEPLIAILRGKSVDYFEREIIACAATALGRIKDKRATDSLIRVLELESENPEDGNHASYIRALGNINDERAILPIYKVLTNDGFSVKNFDSLYVRSFSIKSLHKLLVNVSAQKVKTAALVYKALNPPNSYDEEKEIVYVSPLLNKAREILKDPKAIDFLIKALEDKEYVVREAAVYVFKEKKAGDILIEALKNEMPLVRVAAANALEEIKYTKAADALIKALEDEELLVREAAIFALASIKSEKAGDALIKALEDEEPAIRVTAASALGEKIKYTKAADALIQALEDEESSVSAEAASALGEIKCIKAVEPIIDAMDRQEYKGKFIGALGKLKNPIAVQPIINALLDTNKHKYIAVEALGRIRDERAVEPLINELNNQDSYVRAASAKALGNIGDKRAVEPLINALNDKEKNVHAASAKALGNIGDKRAVEPLINALNKTKEDISNVIWALGDIGDERAVEPLINYINCIGTLRSLGKIGGARAIEVLTAELSNKDEYRRIDTVEALAMIEDEKAIAPLTNALFDKRWSVRKKAAHGLIELQKRLPHMDILTGGIVDVMQKEHHDKTWTEHYDTKCHWNSTEHHSDKGIGIDINDF